MMPVAGMPAPGMMMPPAPMAGPAGGAQQWMAVSPSLPQAPGAAAQRTTELAFRILQQGADGVDGFRVMKNKTQNGMNRYQIGVDVSQTPGVKKIMWIYATAKDEAGALQTIQQMCLEHGFGEMDQKQFDDAVKNLADSQTVFMSYMKNDTDSKSGDDRNVSLYKMQGRSYSKYEYTNPQHQFEKKAFTDKAFKEIEETAVELKMRIKAAKEAQKAAAAAPPPPQGPSISFNSNPAAMMPQGPSISFNSNPQAMGMMQPPMPSAPPFGV
jgi:hypothetical protein